MFEIIQDQLYKDGKPHVKALEVKDVNAYTDILQDQFPGLKVRKVNTTEFSHEFTWFDDQKYIAFLRKCDTLGEALMTWQGDKALMVKAFNERLFSNYLSQAEVDLLTYFCG